MTPSSAERDQAILDQLNQLTSDLLKTTSLSPATAHMWLAALNSMGQYISDRFDALHKLEAAAQPKKEQTDAASGT